MAINTLHYAINDPIELNLSYIPFIKGGGLFVPTADSYTLGDEVVIQLEILSKKLTLTIEGKVVWITPSNALHHVLSGIGVQFTGANAALISAQIEENLDKKVDVGGYTYGILDERTTR
jgi:type IV pilus assembly protein PilZ